MRQTEPVRAQDPFAVLKNLSVPESAAARARYQAAGLEVAFQRTYAVAFTPTWRTISKT